MLRNVNELRGYPLQARDGEIGRASDLFFDDDTWTVRYLVVNTGFLPGRSILISPVSVRGIDDRERGIVVDLSREQVRNSPPLDTDKPVSRQYELEYFIYYSWAPYWGGLGRWGAGLYPTLLAVPGVREKNGEARGDPHLRSMGEIGHYRIDAADDEFGEIEDFLIDERSWAVRYLVVDTVNWWPSKKVLISPHWIERVSWDRREVVTGLDRRTIQAAPAYDPAVPVSREYERALYRHYGNEEGFDKIRVEKKQAAR